MVEQNLSDELEKRPGWGQSDTYLISNGHLFHQVACFKVSDSFPGRRSYSLKIIHAELSEIVCAWQRTILSSRAKVLEQERTLTSLPFTTRESGSAFISQCFLPALAMIYFMLAERVDRVQAL